MYIVYYKSKLKTGLERNKYNKQRINAVNTYTQTTVHTIDKLKPVWLSLAM